MNCETIALDPRPTENDLDTIYPEDYYSFNSDLDKANVTTGKKSFVQMLFFQVIRRNIKKHVVKYVEIPKDRPIRILDIGCGVGGQLDNLKAFFADAETWGVDFGEEAVKRVKERGHKGYLGRFEDLDFPENYFDIIVSYHVIEHVSEPDVFIAKALRLLNDNGVLTLATPNIDSLDFKMFKKRHWGGYHTPRHWYLYNINSFRILAKRLNFQIVDWKPYTLSSFWVVTCNSIVTDMMGKKIANTIFPPVKIMYGGFYAFVLLSFFGVLERVLLLLTGKGNAMTVNIEKA